MELFEAPKNLCSAIKDLKELLGLIVSNARNLNSIIDKGLARNVIHNVLHGEDPICPRCQARLSRAARCSFDAGRRFRCSNCQREINDRSGTLLESAHVSDGQVILLAVLIDLMEKGITPARIAELTGTTVTTVAVWRKHSRGGIIK